jgi:L-ascorbate metabolism protein UlaG (beta-lactamase superfamily)
MDDADRRAGERRERVLASPQFSDGVFRNTALVRPGLKSGTALGTMTEFVFGGQRRVPVAALPSTSPLEAWKRPAETGLRATWLGHSTVLLEIDGTRVLTDPVWGERASPTRFVGPRRFQPVPAPISALPPLDAVVISHDHFDHLDRPSIVELARSNVPFYTSLGVGRHLQSWGVPPARIIELDWWESAEVPGTALRLTAAPSQHFSGRGLGDRNRTLWSSFAMRGARHAVFFSGDTGLTPEYAEIARRLGPFDLVMLEVGAFHPAWGDIHLGPENALSALELLGGGSFLPVHWGTFNLAIHAWDEPAEQLLELAAKRPGPRSPHLVMPRLGEPVEPARAEQVEPWWRAVSALERPSAAPPVAAPELEPVGEPID